ncbi:replication initiator protein [Dipodfec virus UOA04_Rod_809]|nr:replication initiator protein [Dipodfec virus UOA04_Rod_809]
MPCLHPYKFRVRRKFLDRTPDGTPFYRPPGYEDTPLLRYVEAPCHHCYECRKRRASEWRVRLLHEYRFGRYPLVLFVTLSFSPENLPSTREQNRTHMAKLFRRYLDAFNKRFGFRPRFFMVSEHGFADRKHDTMGHRFHFHGFFFLRPGQLFPPFDRFHAFTSRYFGHSWIEKVKSERAINYTLKYVVKNYTSRRAPSPACGIIICSPGFGKPYVSARFRTIFGSMDSPCYLRLLEVVSPGGGKVFRFPVPFIYRVWTNRFMGLAKPSLEVSIEPYLVRYGPFSVWSDAPPIERRCVVDKYKSYLASFSDFDCEYRRHLEEKRNRKLLYDKLLTSQ